MKIVIVGNGVAGTLAAKGIRELDDRAEIVLFSAEDHLYYPRPNLIELIGGSLPPNRLFAFPERWYADHHIDVRLSSPVVRVHPERREVETAGGRMWAYDSLLLADGASSFVPPVKGAGLPGAFTLRTLDDARRILDYHPSDPRVVILGGGLLGLEIARAVKARGMDVDVIEFFPILLPRQLDPRGADLLKNAIERAGIRVLLGRETEEILGPGEVRGLRLKGGEEIPAGRVVFAAGVRPNIELAREAGIATERGVLVDDFLKTSAPGVFAAGDGVQHRGRTYGIIPASFDQARVAAGNILGRATPYAGTTPANTLKVAGIHLTSVGSIHPRPEGGEELLFEDPERGLYKKVVLQEGRAVGAIWMGTKAGVQGITRAVLAKSDVKKWKDGLLDEGFDFSVI